MLNINNLVTNKETIHYYIKHREPLLAVISPCPTHLSSQKLACTGHSRLVITIPKVNQLEAIIPVDMAESQIID